MVSPHSPTTSNSSALFGSDDTSFLEALGAAVLPGDVAQAQNEDTHRLSSSPSPILEPSSLEPPPCAQPTSNALPHISSDDEPEQPATRTPTHAGSHPQRPPFDDDEPSLLQLESPPLAQSRYRKRAHSVSSNDEPARSPTNSPTGVSSSHLDSDTYGASRFGEFGEYMRRKRAKLQIQNAEMGDTPKGEASGSQTFKGLSIHINGWTEPSVQELRKLIVENGGIYQAYIDKKTLVTHIITCSLTPAKVREFKHMKVVKPEWLVQSAKAGVLLPWQDFIFLPGGRPESAHGRLAQSSLTEFSASKPRNSTLDGGRLNPLSSDRNPSAPLHLLQAPSLHPSPPIPKYAKHESNPAAQRAMADPAWRAAHTSAAPGFIAGYYANSRLHHLSTWKAELRTLVVEAQERAERGDLHTASRTPETGAGVSMRGAALVMKNPLKGKEKAGHKAERVVMHVDFDAFFVSAGLVSRPHLRGKAAVVCHSQGGASSTSEIASASYEARKFGIKNGMSLQQARRLCPDLATIPYEFERYRQLSLEFYTILMTHADDLQAVSVDEALIDVTSTVAQMRVVPTGANDDDGDSTSTDIAKELAESMRAQIKAATGCIASIGIAPNIMLARLATRRAKPAGSFHLLPAAFRDLLPDLDIQDLHGFGRAARDKASEKLGTTNLGELAGRSKAALCDALGNAMGETLYNSIRGKDDRKLESDKPRKSVSCDINYGIRFENDDQVEAFIHQMSEEVAHRLDAINTKGRSLTLKIMKRDPSAPVEPPKFMGHGQCVTYNKQSALVGPDGRATSDPRLIGSLSWRLLRTLSIPPRELRGISIHIQKLDAHTGSIPAPGHAHLPFRPAPNPTASGPIVGPAPKARAPSSAPVTAPSEPRPATGADLPSFSQLDMSVFEALPEDIRKELETEYERRSAPAPNKPEPPADPTPRVNSVIPARGGGSDRPRGRGMGAVSSRGRRGHGAAVVVVPGELEELGIDAEVFSALPVRIQREQLAAARGARVRPSQQPVRPSSPLRPLQRTRGTYIPPPPPPRARFAEAERPVLRRGDADTAPVVEGVDVRRVVRAWVELFVRHVPHAEDVALVGGYLVRCVVTDVGAERAVGVMRWWGALLRRRWAVWEHADERDEEPEPGEDIRAEVVGMAWWRAYREVGDNLNVVVRKRFGGSLKFR
ncbi:DNA repair protein [Lactarius pseudohatsudake]|nr:DNA repair protein [Lactarius pseudohatsudake]